MIKLLLSIMNLLRYYNASLLRQQPKYLMFELECHYRRQTQCLQRNDLLDTF